MPEVRPIPNRSRTLAFTGPLPTREHRKIALSVEGEDALLGVKGADHSKTAGEEAVSPRANREAASKVPVEYPQRDGSWCGDRIGQLPEEAEAL